MLLEEEKKENQNVELIKLLKEEHKQELYQVLLIFGEKYKKEGESIRKEFWRKGKRDNFRNLLLQYENTKEMYIENSSGEEKGILDKLSDGGKDKFIEKYMHDKVLFSGNEDKYMSGKIYGYEEWEDGKAVVKEGMYLSFSGYYFGYERLEAILKKIELKEGVIFDLHSNGIGNKGAGMISKIELKEGVTLDLSSNNFWPEGAEAISNIELKEGVKLDLSENNIGPRGAEAISKIELKDGVTLDLRGNKIGDDGADAIMTMELKWGVKLDLRKNGIGELKEKELRNWIQGYNERGMNCEVLV